MHLGENRKLGKPMLRPRKMKSLTGCAALETGKAHRFIFSTCLWFAITIVNKRWLETSMTIKTAGGTARMVSCPLQDNH